MVDLPAEVWIHIGSFAPRQDLVHLALVSQLHLAVVRPILAEEVTLSNRRRSTSDHNRNLQFLVNTQLSAKIRSFDIHGFSKDEAPDIPFGAMPNLRTLHIGACNAFSLEKQKRAVRALRESCKELHTIQISSLSTLEYKKFPIANIVTVEWNEGGYLTPAFFSLCKSSLSTIAHLTISVLAPSWPKVEASHEGITTYKRFFRLHFPSLLSLDIGPGHNSLTTLGDDETNGAFTKFLLAHSTLTKLALPHWEHAPSGDDIYLPVDAESLVDEKAFPTLRYFEAHPRLISELLEADAHFLIANVETLCISEAIHPDYWELDESFVMGGSDEEMMPLVSVLYRLGERRRRTLAVKHLIVHLSKMNEDEDALEFIKESLILAAETLPNIESWVGSIPVTADNFAQLFSELPRIRTITGVLGLLDSIEEDTVLKIATACKHLERVNCLMTYKSFIVNRHEKGGEPRITIRQETFPTFHEDSPECKFIMHEAMYRACKDQAGSEDDSDDWSVSSSDEDEG